MLPIILVLLVSTFTVTHAASSCYSCNNCGTTWDITKASIVPTSNGNDYCRKTVTGSTVTKDYSSSCTPVNLLGNGVFCCQGDLCNSANKQSIIMANLGFLIIFIWMFYY